MAQRFGEPATGLGGAACFKRLRPSVIVAGLLFQMKAGRPMDKRQASRGRVFPPALFPDVLTADDALLRRIAAADYGMEAARHFAALKEVLTLQNGYLSLEADQAFYPAETVELAAYRASDSRAYLICHLMLVQSTLAGTAWFGLAGYRQHYLDSRAGLPMSVRRQLDAAYALAEARGEI